MRRLVSWVAVSGMVFLGGPAGCSGGCGCSGDPDDGQVRKIPGKQRPDARQRLAKRPKRQPSPNAAASPGPQTMEAAAETREQLYQQRPMVLPPGGALQMSGVAAPSEADLNQPHLQGLSRSARKSLILVERLQSRLPKPRAAVFDKEPWDPAKEKELAKKYRPKRRRGKKRRKKR